VSLAQILEKRIPLEPAPLKRCLVDPLRKLSIALVCHSYPPVVGGSEIEAQRVSAALQKRGHRVEILCCGGPPMPNQSRWIDPVGVPVRQFGNRWPARIRDHIYALGVAWTLAIRARQYDAVYFLMSGLHLATGLPVARLMRMPVIMKFSGSSLILHLTKSRLGRLELALLRRWARRILVLNDGMREEATQAQLDPERLMWMPNPVDLEEFCPLETAAKSTLRKQLGLSPDAQVIVYVGRLAPEKELGSLLRAFQQVAPAHPQAVLVLVGNGPSRQNLEETVSKLGLGNQVRFTGMVPVADVPKWLQAGDLFALVSSLEGLPCSLIEAMSAGLPAVTSDIPANLQLLEPGKNGFTARLLDEAEIAAGMSRLLGDVALRKQMGEYARSSVARFSTERVADVYEDLFRDLVDERVP